MNQDTEYYESLLIPHPGQWVVVAKGGHFSKTEVSAGHVKRVTGMSVQFQNRPMGKDVHRLSSVWAICRSERDARDKAAEIRGLQDGYKRSLAEAQEAFWAGARDLGIHDRRAAAAEIEQVRQSG